MNIFDLEFEAPSRSEPEFDCVRQFGSSLYSFFVPIEIGDFVISLWTTSVISNGFGEREREPKTWQISSFDECVMYAASIYEHGEQIRSKDERIKDFSWTSKLDWSQENFTSEEINQMLADLKSISTPETHVVRTLQTRDRTAGLSRGAAVFS